MDKKILHVDDEGIIIAEVPTDLSTTNAIKVFVILYDDLCRS